MGERVDEQDRACHDRQSTNQSADPRAESAGGERCADYEAGREQYLDRECDHARMMTGVRADRGAGSRRVIRRSMRVE